MSFCVAGFVQRRRIPRKDRESCGLLCLFGKVYKLVGLSLFFFVDICGRSWFLNLCQAKAISLQSLLKV